MNSFWHKSHKCDANHVFVKPYVYRIIDSNPFVEKKKNVFFFQLEKNLSGEPGLPARLRDLGNKLLTLADTVPRFGKKHGTFGTKVWHRPLNFASVVSVSTLFFLLVQNRQLH